MPEKVVTLDLREDIRSGRHPLGRIMQAAQGLLKGQSLRLLTPFEPKPLYSVLGNLGLSHRSSSLPDGEFEVVFFRQPAPRDEEKPAAPATPMPSEDGVVDVDARGLEPPQPLVKILEAVAVLSEGKRLRARTDRRPMHLYAQLEERGFHGETHEQADGSFITYVARK